MINTAVVNNFMDGNQAAKEVREQKKREQIKAELEELKNSSDEEEELYDSD